MYKAIIIDDEFEAIKAIELIVLQNCPEVKIIGFSNTIEKAKELISSLNPDFIFLDINMPRGSGFDLLERFPIREFEVIFVSSQTELKEKSKTFHPIDFIEKPISIKKITNSIEKLKEKKKENPICKYKVYPSFLSF
ncbi:MAG: response regulator [Bacteroidetes bacterium]|nr:response regulator [Bacteroidota bacterium]